MTKLVEKLKPGVPWKKRLRRLVEERLSLQEQGNQIVFKLRTVNDRIRHYLEAQDKSKLRLGSLGLVRIVEPVKTTVDVEGLIDWYHRKRPTVEKPPVTYIPMLDEKLLKIHMKKGIISPKRFAKFVTEEPLQAYVRIDKAKGEDVQKA